MQANRGVDAAVDTAALLGEYGEVLEHIALGVELSDSLDALVQFIDRRLDGAMSSIMLAGRDGRLHFAAGAGLPEQFVLSVPPIEIGPAGGACGAAAWRKSTVIVEDTSTDPLFEGAREVAEVHGLRACWSTPILSPKGDLLGTFAVYHLMPYTPSSAELTLLDRTAQIARIAIEHWRMAADLKATTALFRALIEKTSDIVAVSDAEGKIRYESPAVQRVMGYRPEDRTGAGWLDHLHSDDRDRVLVAARTVMSTAGSNGVVEGRFQHKDGTWRTLEIEMCNLTHDPAVGGVVSSSRDITDRQRAAAALAASEERYRELFEKAKDMLCTLDLDGRLTSINGCGEQLTGYTQAQILGRPFSDVVAPEYRDAARQMVASNIGGESGSVRELELLTRQGERVPIEATTRLIFGKGKPVGVQCACRDARERRRLELQLRQSQKMEAVGLLAGGVAHDFNNLLTVITGYTQWLMENLEAGSDAYDSASEVLIAANRAASLTRQLLAFSRKQVMQPSPVDLNQLVAQIDRMLRRVIGEDIELETRMAPDLAVACLDTGQIEQAMLNLVVNARDAMPKGGRLTIETSNLTLDSAAAMADALPPGEYVTLSIGDTGVGMDPETQARIFEPFFTTKEKERGTGLGLSMVYGIVKQSGGHIAVKSAPGEGATFRLYFPRVDADDQVGSEAAGAGGRGGSGDETILLVEDEQGVRNIVRDMLRRRGYRILEASDPASAERLFEEHGSKIDLLLSDAVMPHSSGRELSERLKSRDPNLRVLFMSGYTDDVILHRSIERGTAFLQKPFTPDALARKVREVLDAR